jgi:hypothetical protein
LITEKGSINCQRVTERVFDFIAPIASFNRIQPDHAVCLDEFGIQRCLVFIVHGAVQGFAGVGDLWTSATCFLNALLREVVDSARNGCLQTEQRLTPSTDVRCGGRAWCGTRKVYPNRSGLWVRCISYDAPQCGA